MNPELLEQAKKVWDRHEKADKFEERFKIYPFEEGRSLANDFYGIASSIREYESPGNLEEVYLAELRRRAVGEATLLDHKLTGKPYTFTDVIKIYGIESEDIDNLYPWLLRNKKPTLDAVERIHEDTEVEDYDMDLAMDIPGVRVQAEQFAATKITAYHRKLGKLFERLTQVGGFLREVDAVPTTRGRSYYQPITHTLAIDVADICFMSADRLPQIRERALIRLMGHEGFGHGVNALLTEKSDLPFFLKRSSGATIASLESIAQFYEKQVFNDLKDATDIQRELDIAHKYNGIYQEQADVQKIDNYQLRLFQYGIAVLADKAMGDPNDPQVIRQKIEKFGEVALYPAHAFYFVNGHRNDFDVDGNLSASLTTEIRYAAQPATRALRLLEDRGIGYFGQRSHADEILLRGYWTPIGLVQRASVA
jgi:hypothetical protein